MIEIVYRKMLIRVNHVWFFPEIFNLDTLQRADIYMIHAVSSFTPKNKVIHSEVQHSFITDLTMQNDKIWNAISKTYRYEIKRCEKETLVTKIFFSNDLMENKTLVDQLCKTYAQMFMAKGLKKNLNRTLFYAYALKGALYLTATYRCDEPVIFHVYIADEKNIRLWYSCSGFRDETSTAEELGRLNKALHWFDIKTFKEIGLQVYDWGGVNFDDSETKGIAEFKKRFGGSPIMYQNVLVSRNALIKTIGEFYFRK